MVGYTTRFTESLTVSHALACSYERPLWRQPAAADPIDGFAAAAYFLVFQGHVSRRTVSAHRLEATGEVYEHWCRPRADRSVVSAFGQRRDISGDRVRRSGADDRNTEL